MWRPPATSWTRVTTKNSDVLAPLTSRSLSSSLLAPKTFTNWRRQSLCFPNQTFAITPEVRPLLPDQSNESIQCKDYLRRDLDAYEFQNQRADTIERQPRLRAVCDHTKRSSLWETGPRCAGIRRIRDVALRLPSRLRMIKSLKTARD